MQQPARFTVKKVTAFFITYLELLYAVQDNLLCQPVGFFYKQRDADITAEAMEKSVIAWQRYWRNESAQGCAVIPGP